jgi:hypothetical protein
MTDRLDHLVLAFLGRFVSVLGTTIVGLILGLSYGASQAGSVIDGKPPMGFADGLTSMFVWIINILIGGVAGTALGLTVGMLGMIVYRCVRARRGARRKSDGIDNSF